MEGTPNIRMAGYDNARTTRLGPAPFWALRGFGEANDCGFAAGRDNMSKRMLAAYCLNTRGRGNE